MSTAAVTSQTQAPAHRSFYARMRDSHLPSTLYYIAFGISIVMLISLRNTISSPTLNNALEDSPSFVQTVNAIIVILLVAKLVIKPPSVWGILFAAALMTLAVVSSMISITSWFFWICIFIVSSEGITLKGVAKVFLGVMSAIVVATVIASFLGGAIDMVALRGDIVRHSLGFSHPNTFAICIFCMSTAFAVINFGRNPIPSLAVSAASALVCKLVADSRTAVYVIILQMALILFFYFVKNVRARKAVGILLICMVALVAFASFWLMVYFDPSRPLDTLLNTILSTRFSLAHANYEFKPLSLLGQSYGDVPPVSGYIFYVDDGYCHMVMENGIIPMALFLAGSFGTLIHEVRRGAWGPTLFGLASMLIYAASENYMMQINFNFCLVTIGCVFLYQEGSVLSRDRSKGGVKAKRLTSDSIAPDAPRAEHSEPRREPQPYKSRHMRWTDAE